MEGTSNSRHLCSMLHQSPMDNNSQIQFLLVVKNKAAAGLVRAYLENL
jgi:hypothetical protein